LGEVLKSRIGALFGAAVIMSQLYSFSPIG
jgi:hypothetical protein